MAAGASFALLAVIGLASGTWFGWPAAVLALLYACVVVLRLLRIGRAVDVVRSAEPWVDAADRPPPAPPVVDGTTAQGWYADPTGRHEQRWFSQCNPTALVKDGSIEGRDPPP